MVWLGFLCALRTYRHASRAWHAFLDDVNNGMNLSSGNMAYTAVDGVFQCYRRRLTAAQGNGFAQSCPACRRPICARASSRAAPF